MMVNDACLILVNRIDIDAGKYSRKCIPVEVCSLCLILSIKGRIVNISIHLFTDGIWNFSKFFQNAVKKSVFLLNRICAAKKKWKNKRFLPLKKNQCFRDVLFLFNAKRKQKHALLWHMIFWNSLFTYFTFLITVRLTLMSIC